MSVFGEYERRVAEILGGIPTKTLAIKLDGMRPKGFHGAAVVDHLLASLDEACWKAPSHSVESNWQWRTRLPEMPPSSPEVGLERAICKVDGLQSWSFQMSTCSGLRGKHSDKRRAIDLVRDFGAGHFAFIELKVESDNPLYAAFEILGYYLAFLRARAHGHSASASHDVMKAIRVDLAVVGTDGWYEFSPSRGAPKRRINLDWLCDDLTEGIQQLSIGHPKTALRFEGYPASMNQQAQACFIISRFRPPY